MDPNLTDSQIAAQQAVLALQDGRTELGAAFARIAAIAARQEAQHAAGGQVVNVPRLDVPMRDEQPRPEHLAPVTPLFDATAVMARPAAAADVPVAGQRQADVPLADTTGATVRPSTRCYYREQRGAAFCWQVITWNPATNMWLHAFADDQGRFPDHDAVADPAVVS